MPDSHNEGGVASVTNEVVMKSVVSVEGDVVCMPITKEWTVNHNEAGVWPLYLSIILKEVCSFGLSYM